MSADFDLAFVIPDVRKFWSPAAVAERKNNQQKLIIDWAIPKHLYPTVFRELRKNLNTYGALVGSGIKRMG